jgi:hypothetical protein
MDYKYIEQLLERYWNAETTLEEESILRTFFRQESLPEEMLQWKPFFTLEKEEAVLGDDFDARILKMIEAEEQGGSAAAPIVKAKVVTLTQRLMPLFKVAAVVAIILTLGGALQAPWDSSWNDSRDYASRQSDADTVAAVIPIQAENISDAGVDSTMVLAPEQPKN